MYRVLAGNRLRTRTRYIGLYRNSLIDSEDNKTEDGERHEVVLLVCLLSEFGGGYHRR